MSLAQRALRDDPASPVAAGDDDALAARRASVARLRRSGSGTGDDARRRLRLALAAALALHVLFFLGLRSSTQLHFDVPPETDVIHLRLIDAQPARAPAAPPSVPLPPAPMPVAGHGHAGKPPPSSATPVPVAPVAAPARPAERNDIRALAGPLDLLDRDGSALLPEQAGDETPAKFGLRPRSKSFARDPMVHQSPLPYVATPFDRYWVADDETLLDEWVRKASRQTTYDTVHGTRITCQFFLFLSACGWGPIPRVSIEELKAMRVSPPLPRNSADDPYVPPRD